MAGGRAVGPSGIDGHLITASKLCYGLPIAIARLKRPIGFVGEPETVDPKVIFALMAADMIPVIAPIGSGTDGQTYNINADTAAGAVAGAISKPFIDADGCGRGAR